MTAPERGLLEWLRQVPDPRGRQGLRHSLAAMLAAVCCGMLCGCRGYQAIAQWIHLQEPATWHALGFYRRPPTRNAFRDLLMAVDPQALEAALTGWLTDLDIHPSAEDLQALSLDGKVLRGTKDRWHKAMTMLSFLDQQTGLVFSQTQVHQGTNEAKAALEFLKSLVLTGKLIVADAAYCQRDFCQQIVDQGGDYLIVIKDNQKQLHREARQAFVIPKAFSPLPQTVGS